jgi:hypothetical protein
MDCELRVRLLGGSTETVHLSASTSIEALRCELDNRFGLAWWEDLVLFQGDSEIEDGGNIEAILPLEAVAQVRVRVHQAGSMVQPGPCLSGAIELKTLNPVRLAVELKASRILSFDRLFDAVYHAHSYLDLHNCAEDYPFMLEELQQEVEDAEDALIWLSKLALTQKEADDLFAFISGCTTRKRLCSCRAFWIPRDVLFCESFGRAFVHACGHFSRFLPQFVSMLNPALDTHIHRDEQIMKHVTAAAAVCEMMVNFYDRWQLADTETAVIRTFALTQLLRQDGDFPGSLSARLQQYAVIMLGSRLLVRGPSQSLQLSEDLVSQQNITSNAARTPELSEQRTLANILPMSASFMDGHMVYSEPAASSSQ